VLLSRCAEQGRVGGGRGGRRSRESLLPAAFALTPVPQSRPYSVSHRRSSNRTCGSPASGSRTGFTTGHAQAIVDCPAPREGALRFLLGPAIQLLPVALDDWGSSQTAMPHLGRLQKRSRTRAPSLHRHYPASSVPWAPPTSTGPEADPFRSPRLVAATHHLCGSRTLPRKPCAHADPTTPAGEDGLFDRLLPRPPTAFPLWQEGRLQRDTIEACSGFICFSACALAPWLHQGLPRRLQWAISRLNCSSGYRGVSTIPRTGLAPVGLRDPGGLSLPATSHSLQTSFRAALPPSSTSSA
jgi:hypothetical protein